MVESNLFEDHLDNVLKKLRATLLQKRHDYGPGNLSKHGEFGILVRMDDKVARLNSLVAQGKAPAVENESVGDTWLDVMGYAALALVLRDVGPVRFAALTAEGEDDI